MTPGKDQISAPIAKQPRGGFKRTLRQDLKDIYSFYLDEDARARLSGMGRLRKWISLTFWVLKSMFLKLTPTRRILLLVSLLLFNQNRAALLILLFILLLELKDKLLARDELAIGRAVQVALLPDRMPSVSGWEIWLFTRPANEVGGDLVDYLEISKDRWGVALGDVAGKGLGAALLMAKLQATLRALAPSFDSLAELGTEMNAIIYRDGLRNRFASLVYLELQPDSGQVRFLNAGHLPPIALRGESHREMPRGAPALGIMPQASYTEQHLELQPGEMLLVYSDGLTEAVSGDGEFFGEQRLMDLLPKLRGLSAEAAGSRLLEEIQDFVGDERSSDDLSLVLLKRVS